MVRLTEIFENVSVPFRMANRCETKSPGFVSVNVLFSSRVYMISSDLLLYSPGRASVMCVRTNVSNNILNTLHIRICVPSNKSEFCHYEHTRQLGVVMTVINAMMLISSLSLLILTHPWMTGIFQYLSHTTSKFKSSFRFETTTSVFHQNQACS